MYSLPFQRKMLDIRSVVSKYGFKRCAMNKLCFGLILLMVLSFSSGYAADFGKRISLPYLENFDAVSCPALPAEWSCYVNTTEVHAGVKTYHVGGHSVPQYLQMSNWNDLSAQLYLISPEIPADIPLASVRTELWASGMSNFPTSRYAVLSIGVMADPLDPATYSEISVQTIYPGYRWYCADLQAYNGPGRYIAFKLEPTTTYKTLFLDDIRFRLAPQCDLAVQSFSGESYLICGEQQTHYALLKNQGRQMLSNYSLNLMHSTGIIANTAGQPILPGEEYSLPIIWTDDSPGTDTLWVELVCPTDDTPDNNLSQKLKIISEPEGTIIHTVGNGDVQAPLPIRIDWKYSLSEMIYHADEFAFNGMVSSVVFFSNFIVDGLFTPVSVWMGGTLDEDMSGGWTSSQHLDLVWQGNLDFGLAFYPVHIVLSQPFIYDGGNLIVYVLKGNNLTWILPPQNFACQIGDGPRSRTVYSDNNFYDAAEPPAPSPGQLKNEYPQISFIMGEEPLSRGSLTGFVRDQFGQPLSGVLVRLANSAYIAQSSASGQYILPQVYCGEYLPRLSRGQYVQSEAALQILPNLITEQDFVMQTTANSDPQTPAMPGGLICAQPNPFQANTRIKYSVQKAGQVCLEIFNMKGQKVRSLQAEHNSPGEYQLAWDGCDARGNRMGTGIYLCRLNGTGYSAVAKMLMVR